jgi:hypothetical protein
VPGVEVEAREALHVRLAAAEVFVADQAQVVPGDRLEAAVAR